MKHQCSWSPSDLILLSWQTVPKELCWPELKLLYFQSKPRLNYWKPHVIMQKSQFILQHLSICFENIYGLSYMCLYVIKMWGFFFLCCVWINGFYSLLDSRLAYTSANLVHILLPRDLLYAYCHTNVNVKNVSHDSCTEVLSEWAGICFSCGYGLVLCSSFLLTSLHSDIPKIRKQTPLYLGVQSHECLRAAQFSSAVKRLSSTFCDTVSPLRVRSVSAGHSGSIEVKLQICMDLPTYSQVAYE